MRPASVVAAAIGCTLAIAACGSGSTRPSAQANSGQAQAARATLNFARCMRSHGVPSFPDDLNFQHTPGIDPASPSFKAAETACQGLLPVKRPPEAAPSEQTHAKLVRLANCLRAHGYPNIPDPRPNPPPGPGAPGADRYGTLYGEGDYWIGIPITINAHGAAFVHTAQACGATGV